MQGLAVDFNLIRNAIVAQVQAVTGLLCIVEEPETPHDKRPVLPYMSFKITTPAYKSGDDSKQQVLDSNGNPTSVWNSGGCRRMNIDFNAYAVSHEESFNYMSTWQTALDLADIQQNLRAAGIAVWVIGTVADLSKLLNTGYEGRAHLDCSFGIAMNLQSDLGYIATVPIEGTIITDQGQIETSETVTEP